VYSQIEFVGTDIMQENMRSPLDFSVDGRPARLYLSDSGSILRAEFADDIDTHLIEIREGNKTIASFTLNLKE
jgi:hypothetical protein